VNSRPAVWGLLLAVAGCVHPPSEDTSTAPASNERRLAVAQGWLQGTAVGRGKGAPVILLHGIGGNHHVFDAQVEHLKGRRRVVAYDQRGCGGSSDSPRKLYDIDVMTGDLKAVLDVMSVERAVLVGHSLGAHVIARFAEKFPARAEALVLIDAPGDVRKPVSALVEELKPMDEARFRARLDQFFEPLLQGAAPATREAVLASLHATRREVLEGNLISLGAWDPAPILAQYSGPMVAIVGQDNRAALHRADPRIRTVLVPGSSHWPMLDQPEKVNAALDEVLATAPARPE
jgi:pimeloyl-ACP methyl ester carboxylesterase